MVGMKSSGRAGEQGGGEESERWRAPGVTGEEGLREAKRCVRAGLGVTLSRKLSSSSGSVAESGCAGLWEADNGECEDRRALAGVLGDESLFCRRVGVETAGRASGVSGVRGLPCSVLMVPSKVSV